VKIFGFDYRVRKQINIIYAHTCDYDVPTTKAGDITRDESMAKKVTRLFAVSFVLCFILFFSANSFTLQAKSTKTTYDCSWELHTVGGPAKMWETPGFTHIRSWLHEGYLTGDLDWDILYDGNNNLDLATFTGVGWGPISFITDSGTFDGKMVLHFENFYITGKFVCHGTGGFAGMHLKGTVEADFTSLDPPVITVVIHNPHG
jgi:hypothetical protein